MEKNYFKVLILLILAQGVYAQIPLAKSNYKTSINSYLNDVKTQYNITDDDVSDLVINKEYYSSKTKITHVYLTQRYKNIEIFNSETSIAIKDDKVFYFANRFQSDVSAKINTTSPNLSAEQAIRKAAVHFKLPSPNNLEVVKSDDNKEFNFSNGDISQENIPAKLVFFLKDGQLRLSWDISIYTLDSKHWWSVRLDAVSGEILNVNDWVVSCNFGNAEHKDHNHKKKDFSDTTSSINLFKNTALVADGSQYNVFSIPTESPNHGGRQIVSNPANDVASPHGWHDDDNATGAEYTITRGNNVLAQLDDDGNNGTGFSPEGTASLNFNFPLDFNQPSATYHDAAITNLFYMNNIMHDVWYLYGFDENAGNFQEHNYRRGAADGAGDHVNADAQDGSGTNNANFGTPPDGFNPRMQMFLWDKPGGEPLIINNGSLAGSYTGLPASFGANLPITALSADLVLIEDDDSGGTSSDPNDGCDIITNGAALTGKIAVIRRGDCEFGFKVLSAENQGAIAAIVVNNVANPEFVFMGEGDVGGSVTIPSISVSQSVGESIISALNNGETINASLIQPDRIDGDFDNGIIAHEYGHGISNRLTGGPSNADCLQPCTERDAEGDCIPATNTEQMGEGWSDWFTLMMTMKPSDLPETGRGIGTFVINQTIDGSGIRPAKYSTDFNVNNFTYDATNDTANISAPHGVGFVWATMLWDLTWAYVEKYGFDPDLYNGTGGNNKVMQLVMDGMKLQPCSPGFVDGRDAILAADMALTGGEDQCMIWEVFAKRGLGFAAFQGNSLLRVDQTEDFSMPDPGDPSLASCTTLSTEEFNLDGYKVYPNPTNDKLFIRTSTDFGEVKMKLIDLNGRIVLTKEVNLFGGEVDIDISRLNPGIYILNVRGLEINRNNKIIKN